MNGQHLIILIVIVSVVTVFATLHIQRLIRRPNATIDTTSSLNTRLTDLSDMVATLGKTQAKKPKAAKIPDGAGTRWTPLT